MARQYCLSIRILLSFLLIISAQAYDTEDLSNKEGREILCSVLTKLKDSNGKNVWPGYNPLQSPLIVKFDDHVFGYGDPKSFKGWKKVYSKNCLSYLAPRTFIAPKSPLLPYLDFNNSKAFFFDTTIKPKLSAWVLSAIIHERFHRFQWEHFSNTFYLLSSHYSEHTSIENVASVLLENSRLISYLELDNSDDWIDFLSISTVREPVLANHSKRWELGQQIAKGTATYVQLKAFDAIENEFKLQFRDTWKQKMIGNLDETIGVDGAIKWRHYAVGGMLCDYLDQYYHSDKWKMSLQTENKESLFQKVIPLIGIDRSLLKKKGKLIVQSGAGGLARTKASSLIAEYLLEIKDVKNLIETSLFQVSIERPKGQIQCFGGGGSERTYYLPNGGTLGLNYSGSYQCNNKYLEAYNNISVLQETLGFSYFGIDELKIWLNSTNLILTDGVYLFKNIEIIGSAISMNSTMSGSISISGTKVSIKFEDAMIK